MTYCVGLSLRDGLVMLADTRTNAGLDNISSYSKTTKWVVPGERSLVLMSSGNLAITQAVLHLLEEGVPLLDERGKEKSDPVAKVTEKDSELLPDDAGNIPVSVNRNSTKIARTLYDVTSMYQAARLIGRAIRVIHAEDAKALKAQDTGFNASFLLGGQIRGGEMALFQIYSAGNFINATMDTPFLQIGEHKYGKPILDRALSPEETSLQDGVKLALISMSSTIRSNLSVGFPLDLVVYEKDKFNFALERRFQEDDAYYQDISSRWSEALKAAYLDLPVLDWDSSSSISS
ncbi:MAG: peptidase [Alphaproteobacteria bacterium]|nr:peptidase [Alphaproteobacteria bacterium]